MVDGYCFMGPRPRGRFYPCCYPWDYIGLFGTGLCRYCVWVELPVQRRLCSIFLRWCRVTRRPLVFRGLTGSQRTPGFRGVTLPLGCRWRVPLTRVLNPSGVLLLYRDQLDAQTSDQVIICKRIWL